MATLKKIAIAHPLARWDGFNGYFLIAVFDNMIVITGSEANSNANSWYMLAPLHLPPRRNQDAVNHAGRLFAVKDDGTCFMWDPRAGGKQVTPYSSSMFIVANAVLVRTRRFHAASS